MMCVLESEGEAWGREGGVEAEAAVVCENDTGVDETDGGDDEGWNIVGTARSES